MPLVGRTQIFNLIGCIVILGAASGCTSLLNQQLAASSPAGSLGLASNSLIAPPVNTLQIAVPDNTPGAIEEGEVSPDVPTLTELSQRPVEGIDAPKVASQLEEDIALKKISSDVRWRGNRGADGIDVTDLNGTLCSAPPGNVAGNRTVRLACSDGRIGVLTIGAAGRSSQILFKGSPAEMVELD